MSETIGARLKLFADLQGWSDAELSRRLGISKQGLSGYTQNKIIPGGAILQKLSQLGCDINWLLNGDNIAKEPLQSFTGTIKQTSGNVLTNVSNSVTQINDELQAKDYIINLQKELIEKLKEENAHLKNQLQK